MTADQSVPSSKMLPEALLGDFAWHVEAGADAPVVFEVPEDYEQIFRNSGSASEVLGIQRLISLVRRASISVRWGSNIAARVSAQPHLFPLLAILLLLDTVTHVVWTDGAWQSRGVKGVGKEIQTHKLLKTKPGESDLTVSLEGRVSSLAPDLYDITTQRLLPRENFVTLAVDLFGAQIDAGKPVRDVYNKANLLGTILAELIENSEMHGRLDAAGRPILSSAVRGVMFRRVKLTFDEKRTKGEPATTKEVECFEASIFDSGIGYYESYTREPLTTDTDVSKEWVVLHKCLERHFYPELPDSRPAHRGLGLYESLRALQVLKGRIEFRTGSVYAYRTFFDEELQASMEERKPLSHMAWPKPRLLDMEKKYLAVPTKQELLTGSSVRILVPLG
jgi:hypothetical protein